MRTTPEPERLYTPAEVSRIFSVHPKTVTRWAKAGRITSVRTLGGHRRYKAADVEALLRGDEPDGHCPDCRYLFTSPGHLNACGGTS